MLKIALSGCNGRMGQVITRMCRGMPALEIVAGFDVYTERLSTYPVYADPYEYGGKAGVIIDFSNASALLNCALRDINWVGFYFMCRGELLLGPFQGKPACMHIPHGKGVCGTAVLKNETQCVPNVHEFPGHIACDSASNSEIVIPLCHQSMVVGVLDIDSASLCRFDAEDVLELEQLAHTIEEACDWESFFVG